jgi:hypothetical protein
MISLSRRIGEKAALIRLNLQPSRRDPQRRILLGWRARFRSCLYRTGRKRGTSARGSV